MEMIAEPPAPLRYASFWKRLNAYGFDAIIVTVIGWLAAWILGDIAHAQAAPDLQKQLDVLSGIGFIPSGTKAEDLMPLLQEKSGGWFNFDWSDAIIPLLVSAIYNIWYVAGPWQATPGKRFCKIKVVNTDGSALSLTQSALRHAASGVSTLALGLPMLTICFTKEKLAPHDMICHTRVVRTDKPRGG